MFDRTSKVCQDDPCSDRRFRKKHIFRLEVSVYYAFPMEKLQSLENLVDFITGIFFLQTVPLLGYV